MADDYKTTENLNVRKSLFSYTGETSFAKRFVPEFVDCREGMRVLDVGCGTGEDLTTIAKTVPGCTLFGIDTSGAMIDEAKKKVPQGIFTVANMETFLLNERFDRIIVRHALHLAQDKKCAVQNIVNHLAPKGKVIFALHSTQSLPKISAVINTFCTAHGCTFTQSQDALAIEKSEKLFTSHEDLVTKTITTDVITLTEPTPYLSYIESRRASFSPSLSDELFHTLLEEIRSGITAEIEEKGIFSEESLNGIVILKKRAPKGQNLSGLTFRS